MIEFTILLDNSDLAFEPYRKEPSLELMLPPTARIGDNNDNVLLAPIPVHTFFNAVVFSRWFAEKNNIPVTDAFSVYLLHDMFKSLLRLRVEGENRKWPHAGAGRLDFFPFLKSKILESGLFADPDPLVGYELAARHHHYRRQGKFKETVDYEVGLDPQEPRTIGLVIRLQPALSNVFALTYLKAQFIDAYVEALRAEYPSVFSRFKEITYSYRFLEPAHITGNIEEDLGRLCTQSDVRFEDGKLGLETFIGTNSMLLPGEQTVIRLPFWMLLILQQDPTSVIFPVPALPSEAPNTAFEERVREGFNTRIAALLQTIPSTARGWPRKLADLTAHIGTTVCLESGAFGKVRRAAETDIAESQCALCGSSISKTFLCLPARDLGWSADRYTDWHVGDAGSVCLLCAISHFKVPPAFALAEKLMKQQQLVYFSTSTPYATGESLLATISKADLLPFFTAEITPQLIINSLESMVTLNLLGALYLHSAVNAAQNQDDEDAEPWLEHIADLGPYSFVGRTGPSYSDRDLPQLLSRMRAALGRSVMVVDPLLIIQVEIPVHALVGVAVRPGNPRHYELKFKPLMVSNELGTLPVVSHGYHFIDQGAVQAIEEIERFLECFRSSKVSVGRKIAAIATDPQEFVALMVEVAKFNYETVHERLVELANGADATWYLRHLRTLVTQYTIIRELWRR